MEEFFFNINFVQLKNLEKNVDNLRISVQEIVEKTIPKDKVIKINTAVFQSNFDNNK